MAQRNPEKITGKEKVFPRPPQNNKQDSQKIFKKLTEVHKAFFRTFLESSIPIALSTLQEGRIINVSDAFLKVTGFSREEIIGYTSAEAGIITQKARDSFVSELNTNNYVDNLQIDIRTKTGLPKHGLLSVAKITMDEEQYLISVILDITELKILENELAKSEKKYRELFNNCPAGIYQTSPDGRIVTANQALADMLGYGSPEDLINSVADIASQLYLYPQDRVRVMELIKNEGHFNSFEVQGRKKNGDIIWALLSFRGVKDEQGNVLYHEGTCKDITELKKAQELLRSSEIQYRQLYESMTDGFVSGDFRGYGIDANNAFLMMIGYSREELPSLNYKKITPKKWHPLEETIIKEQLLARGYSDTFEKEYVRKDGTVFPVELRTMLIRDESGNPSGFWSIVRDITTRKKADQQLRESEEKYRLLYQSMMDGYGHVDMDGNFMDCNDSFQQMTGYTRQELLKLKYLEITPEKWHALENYLMKKQLFVRGYTEIYEKEYRRKDGSIFPVELRAVLLRDKEGKPASVWAIVHDITERKRAQEALAKSEKKYRLLHHSMMDGFSNIDMKGRFMEFNESFLNMLGYSPEELRQLGFRKITPERWHEFEDTVIREQLFTRGYTDVYEKEYRRKDGSIFPVELRAVLLRDEEGNPVSIWAIIRDITIRKREEEKIAKSEEIYRLIAENVTGFIILLDREGVIQHTSGAKNILDYEMQELKNINSVDLVHPEDGVMLKNIFREDAIRKMREIVFDLRMRHKNGNYVTLEIRARPLIAENNDFIGNVFTGRHISERQKLNGEDFLSSSLHLKDRRITGREREVLKWIMDGKSTWDISHILNISESTVKFHVDNIMKKFNAVNRAHAVAIFLQGQQNSFK